MLKNITIKQLRGFIVIADAGSFPGASEHLSLSQPALSSTIRNLEEAVRGPLFNLSTRACTNTEKYRVPAYSATVSRRLARWF